VLAGYGDKFFYFFKARRKKPARFVLFGQKGGK
jgi:hypothetical protein